MKNLKLLGFAALLISMIGLSGCETSSNSSTSPAPQNQVVPEEPIASEDPEIPDNNASTEENTAPETNTTTEKPEEPDIPEIPESLTFTPIPIEESAHAMTNNGKSLVYGTVDGFLYSLNPETGESSFMYDVNPFNDNLLIGGLSYIGNNQYLYSSVRDNIISRLNIDADEVEVVTEIKFADGLDAYQNRIYSVTYNKSGILTVFNMDGEELYTLHTEIDDMVGVANSSKYLYILSESGNIYQTSRETGRSHLIIENTELFESGDSFGGVEAIDILDNYIYLSNVNDSTVYRINVDIRAYE
ncbi:MAG: hypothetical protein U9R26_05610 [Campylobacterota bacterium]|nr:hypothetical protein [Campylobacterota bacterium]